MAQISLVTSVTSITSVASLIFAAGTEVSLSPPVAPIAPVTAVPVVKRHPFESVRVPEKTTL